MLKILDTNYTVNVIYNDHTKKYKKNEYRNYFKDDWTTISVFGINEYISKYEPDFLVFNNDKYNIDSTFYSSSYQLLFESDEFSLYEKK